MLFPMADLDGKSINQILLSPLHLLNHILGTLVPGVLFLAIVANKQNAFVLHAWNASILGYRTKVVVWLAVSFVVGNVLRMPFQLLGMLRKSGNPPELDANFMKGQPEELRRLAIAAIADGVLHVSTSSIDRASLMQTDAAFHIGTGTALVFGGFFPGDGHMRVVEFFIGLAMIAIGIKKGRAYQHYVSTTFAVGFMKLIGNLTPAQIELVKAAARHFGIGQAVAVAASTNQGE